MANKRRNGTFDVKIQYENIPITKQQVRGVEGLDKLVNELKRKFQ